MTHLTYLAKYVVCAKFSHVLQKLHPQIKANFACPNLPYVLTMQQESWATVCTHTALSKAVVERYLNFFYSNFDAIIHKPLLCYPPVVSIYIEVPNYFSLSFFCFQDLEKLPTVPTYIVDEFR